MTHHEPILISEIRYLDHISWPRFWISALIWPVTLSVAIMVTTFWIAEANGWTPHVFISVVSTSVFSAYFSLSMLLARFYRYRISLNPSEISINGWLWTSTFPIDGLQMRQGVLNEDRYFYWAHSIPCVLIQVDESRRPRLYAVDLMPKSSPEKPIPSRTFIYWKSFVAGIFCVGVIWTVGLIGFYSLELTPLDISTVSYMWALATGAPFLGYYVARLSWYAWLKDSGLLEPFDIRSTASLSSEFITNFIAVAIFMGAIPDVTYTGPMTFFLLSAHAILYLQCAHIVRSDMVRINELISQRQRLACNTITNWLTHQNTLQSFSPHSAIE